MKHVKKAERRIARQLKAIDQREVRLILQDMLRGYGVADKPLPELPRLWTISDEKAFQADGLVLAMAAENHPTYYVRGILHGARTAPFELLLFHVYCHELMHYLGRRILKRAILRGVDEPTLSVEMTRSVAGFNVYTTYERDSKVTMCLFGSFNEGVTEMLGYELMKRSVYRLRPRNVTENDIAEYLERDEPLYKPCVKFVRELLNRFAATSGVAPQKVLSWFVQAYVDGTDLRTDTTWEEYVERAGLPANFTLVLANATEDEIESLYYKLLVKKLKLNPALGNAFDDIRVTVT